MADAQEIERKFLVGTMPDLSGARASALRQGYVTAPEDTVELRLRQSDDSFVLSIKSGEGMVRSEREIAIDAPQFETLWPATEGRRIEKTRWTGDLGAGLVYELDIFAGDLAGLLTVEVEFGSAEAADAFVPPDWFGAEVTSDKRYRNKSLALSGADLIRDLRA
ncbi:MAG: CYTH domain-containing protein [Paracoccus sp. (in: a-proteobacteria)]